MKKIKFKGKEVTDVVHTSIRFVPSIKMRLSFLICRRVFIEQEIGCEKEPGDTDAITHVHTISLLDAVRSYWRAKNGYGQMVAPDNLQEHEV